MLDPKILLIQYKAGRLAKKLVDRSSAVPENAKRKRSVLDSLENFFGIRLTESQVVCALLMHQGCFAQLSTGEGKTFSIALSAAWLAIEGRHVHVVAPNEYLSNRDFNQLKPFFEGLNLNVAWIGADISESARLPLYKHDIVYTTPSVIAFDQMRERSKNDVLDGYQHISPSSHLIIDEADAVLIENGSVPFIFAKNIESDVQFWRKSVQWINNLPKKCFEYDIQTESTYLSGFGYEKFEEFMVSEGFITRGHDLYSAKSSGYFHRVTMAVRAVKDFSENRDYLVSGSEIVILNQSTGRTEKDRQWGQGLHQAIEAKHDLDISSESEVVSKITIPEVLSLYSDFSGTSATISHAKEEIFKRYGRFVIDVRRAHQDNRIFYEDLCFDSKDLKQDLVAEDAKCAHERGQPVLIGVESIEDALELEKILQSKGVFPSLLTAKNEDIEAEIIAEAGRPGALTIATNMAGRGTDIRLGGSDQRERDKAIASGGLHVIGSSRQPERRLDDQLSGRCGRQGDPGSVRFYISLGDRLFKDQDKITSIRKVTKKSLALLQKSKANKISVSRDEIDAYNDVFLIHRDIYYSLRRFWSDRGPEDVFDELLNLFIANLREDLLEYGINKNGAYKDFEGFMDRFEAITHGKLGSIGKLNEEFKGEELCAKIEKKTLQDICYNVNPDHLVLIKKSVLDVFDDMWCDHQMLLEQIYDHSKWQALIQKNERIQFSIFGFEAMSDFIYRIEKRILQVIFEGLV